LSAASTRLTLRVAPRATSSRVVGRYGDAWKVQLAAAPVDGRANEALRGLLADVLDVRREALTIVAGRAGRDKVVEIAGRDAREADRLMQAAAGN
jgi:uncharacterized protein YggU (UPF0235/DUF167 family)